MYTRLCSCCSKEVNYVNKYSFQRAVTNESVCPSCRTANNNRNRIPKKGPDNHAWAGYKNVPGKVFSRLKHGAKQRNIFFDLTIEDIYNKYQEQFGLCAFTNKLLTFGEDASIDRIDSTKGYYYDNIQIVHKVLNMMKKDMDNEDFLSWCRRVHTRNFE